MLKRFPQFAYFGRQTELAAEIVSLLGSEELLISCCTQVGLTEACKMCFAVNDRVTQPELLYTSLVLLLDSLQ